MKIQDMIVLEKKKLMFMSIVCSTMRKSIHQKIGWFVFIKSNQVLCCNYSSYYLGSIRQKNVHLYRILQGNVHLFNF